MSHAMTTFIWLLIGHLLGDWLLQNDWMARGKKQALLSLAGMAHCALYSAVIVAILWFAGDQAHSRAFCVPLGITVFVSHWLIDGADVAARWMRFYRQSNLEMVRVMVDQTLHNLVLAWAALLSGM